MEIIHESKLFRYLNIKLSISERSRIYYLYETDEEFKKEVEITTNHVDDSEFFIFINRKTDFDKVKNWLEYAMSHEYLAKEMRKWKINKIVNKEGS